MSGEHLSEFEKARALRLAQQLADKIEQYFPEPPEDGRTAEIVALRTELEKMGFLVTWEVSFDPETLQCSAQVTLWLPKNNEESNLPPG